MKEQILEVLGLTTVEESEDFLRNTLIGNICSIADLEKELHKHLAWIYIVNSYVFVVHFDGLVDGVIKKNPNLESRIRFNAALIDRIHSEHFSSSLSDEFNLWEDRRVYLSDWYVKAAQKHPRTRAPN